MSIKKISTVDPEHTDPNATTLNLSFKNYDNIPEWVWDRIQLTKLVIAGNPITKVSKDLRKLENLVYLNLGSSAISSFPECALSNLPNLTYLNISENKLKQVPSSIGELTQLTELSIGSNKEITTLPPSLGHLQHLTILKLGNCRISVIPQAIGQLHNLKDLQLQDNTIEDLPSFLWELSSLEMLNISKNKITSLLEPHLTNASDDELDRVFSNMRNLKVLTMNDNAFTDIPPHTVANFESLEVLSAEFNLISRVPADLSRLQNLVLLDVSANRIRSVPEEWGNLASLVTLDISYNDITEIPPSYARLSNLKVLTLMGNDIPAELPEVCQELVKQGKRVRNNDKTTLPDKIIEGLWLGGVSAARDKYSLKKMNIKYILTVADLIDPMHGDDFEYKVIQIDDHSSSDLYAHFKECTEFIKKGIDAGGVLVHCAAGVSRSATIVIMYVMASQQKSMEEAMGLVRECRSIICPNPGFRNQLAKYEEELRSSKNQERCIVS
eukprot:TRINITY_DN3372_c0_g1_i2.p1 TRINITY_DN3372_c0_g1~~TRINITY_DN3372_c0_g1_i2.p1  ORF type:complete len:497 (-),score=80.20 TRINITY_DN3372_c0_g1_i2:120-1610(-)